MEYGRLGGEIKRNTLTGEIESGGLGGEVNWVVKSTVLQLTSRNTSMPSDDEQQREMPFQW